MTMMLPAKRRTTRAASAGRPVALLGIGTAAANRILQATAARLAEPLCCDTDQQRQFLQRIYAGSGIHTRSSVLLADDDPDFAHVRAFYRPRTSPADFGPTTSQRMALYAQHAPALALTAARRALDASAISPHAITHLIPVTCTGFFAPGLDAHLINQLNLRPDVHRIQLGFMGCHGAFNALAAAMQVAAANPSARILICCVELCTLHLAYGFDPQKLIANALFADGAAAAIVGQAPVGRALVGRAPRPTRAGGAPPPAGQREGASNADPPLPVTIEQAAGGGASVDESAVLAPAWGGGAPSRCRAGRPTHAAPVGRGARPTLLHDASSCLIPDSRDAMTWQIGDHGFTMTLSPRVPELICQHVPAWITPFLQRHNLTLTDIAHYAIHPGGPKILTACADALGFSPDLLSHSRQILHDYGNMSSATILFVLESLLSAGLSGPTLALGFGPGLMAESLLLTPCS